MIINFNNVSKKINGINVVNDMSFSLAKGHVLALLGPNGAGKTTTIRLLTGLIVPNNGDIVIFNQKLNSRKVADKLREKISVQNDGSLYENLSIIENLRIWANLYNIPAKRAMSDIAELLDVFELVSRSDDKVKQLSKGMRQKILLIRSLLPKPKLLILDEPTSGLDPQTSRKLIDCLESYIEEKDTTIIMATHQLDGLEQLATDILIMNSGRVIVQGEANRLINEHWPTTQLKIELDNANKARDYFDQNFSNNYFFKNEKVYLTVKNKQSIPRIIATITSNVDVIGINKVEHTIKELYFDLLGKGVL
ncbi:ABC transporter ATP-binding protein [Bombilactobacillus thymidiniphilus]|uniref:ABC transporter ATP-binding protein n=1 Tax=Bombilactobacillus thymidiniphilus TaxID=2923363 RepID=A0ABY4PEN3_9LACO|nr:ABC transporter ATP-binding protein [Bombilactobacillus thymidiniphilus]UQS84128.1 ABC transporter ATP-binding protein [Bombilactobacillus thymidiniphilus]